MLVLFIVNAVVQRGHLLPVLGAILIPVVIDVVLVYY